MQHQGAIRSLQWGCFPLSLSFWFSSDPPSIIPLPNPQFLITSFHHSPPPPPPGSIHLLPTYFTHYPPPPQPILVPSGLHLSPNGSHYLLPYLSGSSTGHFSVPTYHPFAAVSIFPSPNISPSTLYFFVCYHVSPNCLSPSSTRLHLPSSFTY